MTAEFITTKELHELIVKQTGTRLTCAALRYRLHIGDIATPARRVGLALLWSPEEADKVVQLVARNRWGIPVERPEGGA